MMNRVSRSLNFGRISLVLVAGIFALAIPFGLGVVEARQRLAAGGDYAFTTIDVPGSSHTVATGIEVSGRTVGYFVDSSGNTHGFTLNNGGFQTIDYPGARWTVAYGINNQGQIVGAFGSDSVTGRHGFLLGGGTFSTFDVPDSVDTVGRSINNRGQIVGEFVQRDGQRRSFLLSGGNYTIISLPEKGLTTTTAINDAGQIAGAIGTGSDDKGFIITGESFLKVQIPESPYSAVLGMNNLGDVVGQLDSPQAPFRAFKRTAGSLTVIPYPDQPYAWNARAINDRGQIVGEFTDRSGKTHGYQASPATLKSGPAESDGVKTITTDNGDPTRNNAGPARGEPRGNRGPGPSRGDVATNPPAAKPPVSDLRPLEATRESLERASTALERLIVNGENGGRGGRGGDSAAAKKCVDAIALVVADVNAAIDYGQKNQGAVTSSRFLTAGPIDEVNDPRMRPVAGVAINNLKRAKHMLDQAIGGDLGGFRPKIEADIANAISVITAAYTSNPAAEATPAK